VNQAFEATTDDITVTVRTFYLADKSEPERSLYFWAYRINIMNDSRVTVQLLARSWRITDANGRVQTITGEGVVGEQPVLEPGESFEYTSGTPLSTATGFMTGQYHMIRVDGREAFDIAIPTFSLDSPHQNTRLH
jgi:ApaG protein